MSRSDVLRLFMLFQVVLDCFGCAELCEAALIQVVLVLSVVFVCSGLLSTVFSCLRLR